MSNFPERPKDGAFSALITPQNRLIVARSKRENSELELPGGGVEPEESLLEAAQRETFEEVGIRTLKPAFWAVLRSQVSQARTGLFVYKLTGEGPFFDPDFSSNETSGVLSFELKEFSRLPTRQEDPGSSNLTFRGHRVLATVALGFLTGELHSTPENPLEDSLSAPFRSPYLQKELARFY